jgi:hypothetical protein
LINQSSTQLPQPTIPNPKPDLRALFGSSPFTSSSSSEEDTVQIIQVVQHPSPYPVPSTVTVPAPAASASQQSSSEQTTSVSQLREAYSNCLLYLLPTKLLLKAACKQSSVSSQPSPIIWTTLSTALSTLTATHPSFVKHL